MKILLTTIPKSGSHLFKDILGITDRILGISPIEDTVHLLQKFNRPMWGHISPVPEILDVIEEKGYKVVFGYRSPRDLLVSNFHHWKKRPMEWVAEPALYSAAGDKMAFLIEVFKPYYDTMMKWKEIADATLRYENVLAEPERELLPLVELTGISMEVLLDRASSRTSATKRKGVVGNWVKEFTPLHELVFRRVWCSE